MTFRKIIFILISLTLLLASCTSSSEPNPVPEPNTAVPTEAVEAVNSVPQEPTNTAEPPPPTEEPEPSPTAVPTETPEPEPEAVEAELEAAEAEPEAAEIEPTAEDLTIIGAEDLPIETTLYSPGGSEAAPGVILLHMLGGSRTIWDTTGLANSLQENGYTVLAVDMRGHGETGSSPNWALAAEDLQLVWDHFSALDNVDPQRTAVVGGSIGGNLALITAAEQPAVRTTILLSPGLDYRGVTTEEPMAQYGQRPILIVASEEDAYSADSSRTLSELAQGESQLEIYNGAGHGTRMFNAKPELSDLILTWLNQNLN